MQTHFQYDVSSESDAGVEPTSRANRTLEPERLPKEALPALPALPFQAPFLSFKEENQALSVSWGVEGWASAGGHESSSLEIIPCDHPQGKARTGQPAEVCSLSTVFPRSPRWDLFGVQIAAQEMHFQKKKKKRNAFSSLRCLSLYSACAPRTFLSLSGTHVLFPFLA